MSSNTSRMIDELEAEHIHQLLAPTIFLVILMVIGIPGNLTILIIFWRKYKRSVYRTIVWNLAVVDQTFCAVGIPFNIARIIHYYSFRGEWICIIGVVMLYFLLVYSTHLLMLLSIHRFRKICFPTSKHMNANNVKYGVVACLVIAVALSSPHFALSKYVEVDLGDGVKGRSCAISLAKPSIYSTAASYTFLALFVSYTIVLIIMYSLIGRKLYLQRKRQKETKTSAIDKTISSKITKIAFAISVVFAMSYIPVFTLQITNKYIPQASLNGFSFSLLRIVERLYVINHVANPFIYGAFDSQFKGHLKDMFRFPIIMRLFAKKQKPDENVTSEEFRESTTSGSLATSESNLTLMTCAPESETVKTECKSPSSEPTFNLEITD